MLLLNRLNREPLVVNVQTIALVERTPDTLLVLTNGDRVHVRESVEEIIEKTVEFLARVQAAAFELRERRDGERHSGRATSSEA